ncbi:hypothetical protein [Streptomyces litchfieldiae]|uniref:Peptidase inhibitor family I36 n=1 Tax=Streptomyces litchfieldiae TaxID=3075543 RepID=A0ABU2MSE3_9ACTN|nr:hypothetical protein [Streptomyces sp. DSM 44938]MDT0344556.1 hypothetical protein [Streptomyces sp. DSM 44938]
MRSDRGSSKRLRAFGLAGAAVFGLALVQAPASSAEDGAGGDVGTLATSYVGDTCNPEGIRDCLYLHYNSYDGTYLEPEGACHMTNRNISRHWGIENGSNDTRYVFRDYQPAANPDCWDASGDGQGLVNNAASYFNADCVSYQIYAGNSGQGHSQMLRYGNELGGPLASGIKNDNQSHYTRSGC